VLYIPTMIHATAMYQQGVVVYVYAMRAGIWG
jgi:hypothetical protein